MFSLTPDERKVILFILAASLAGLGIDFSIKINSRLRTFVVAETNIAKININQASLEDLIFSRCVSASLARKIIARRDTQGRFNRLEDLKEIEGIGPKRYEKLEGSFFAQ
ncbi:MAG: helix-hairpin-helix domain-containing protein [Candidatus Omnitrophica bacterium]|nr:helix-hairpin-helix domain-containing protein [Candidatus Omnitrophota bacterium]